MPYVEPRPANFRLTWRRPRGRGSGLPGRLPMLAAQEERGGEVGGFVVFTRHLWLAQVFLFRDTLRSTNIAPHRRFLEEESDLPGTFPQVLRLLEEKCVHL